MVVLVGAGSRVAFVLGAVLEPIADTNPLDDEDAILDLDVPLDIRKKAALISGNPARLQRATQGAGQSPGRGGDDVVERGRVRFECAWGCVVVLSDFVVHAELDRRRLRREKGATE